MSNSTVISMLNRFADVFDVGRLDAETIHTMAKWWERALSDLSDSQVEEAAELVIAHRLNRTFPLPAHVLEAAEIIRQVRVIIRKS